jgi:hypothetical protein
VMFLRLLSIQHDKVGTQKTLQFLIV